MIKSVTLIALFFFGVGFAAKGGKGGGIDTSDVVNPDPDAQKAITTAEYNPDLMEGDMGGKGGNSEDRNAVSDKNKLWPQGIVPFELDGSLSEGMKKKIKEAQADYSSYTCVKFQPRNQEKDYVLYNSMKSGCFAYKGRWGGQQPINLQPGGCEYKGTIIHEMLHTIGFAHEQSRSDRDKYVKINWNNIFKDAHDQFEKLNVEDEDTQGFGYDFASVMHYGPEGFSKNGRPAITTKDPANQNKIGQRAGFSKQDLKEVNKLYKCNGKTSGVGGKNGCMDRDGKQCAEVMKQHGKDRACSSRGNIPQFCAATCGTC